MKVGVTGHQNFGPEADMGWLSSAVRQFVRVSGITEGVTSLARGADQLFAAILVDNHIPFLVVLACKDIESSFEENVDLAEFRRLRSLASSVEVLPYEHPSEQAYMAAGKWLVSTCDCLLAMWDGKPARGLGGTGDIVALALGSGRKVLHLNPYSREFRTIAPC